MAEIKVADRVSANCIKRSWTDRYGQTDAFLGPAKKLDSITREYALKNVKTGQILDCSSASGYGVQLTIFQQFRPGIVK